MTEWTAHVSLVPGGVSDRQVGLVHLLITTKYIPGLEGTSLRKIMVLLWPAAGLPPTCFSQQYDGVALYPLTPNLSCSNGLSPKIEPQMSECLQDFSGKREGLLCNYSKRKKKRLPGKFWNQNTKQRCRLPRQCFCTEYLQSTYMPSEC